MHLAINLLWVSARDQTGAFVYVKNLLDQLLKLDRTIKFFLIIRARDRFFFKPHRSQSNVVVYVCDPCFDLGRRPILAVKKFWAKLRQDDERMENLVAQELNHLMNTYQIRQMFFPTQKIYPRGLQSVEHDVTVFDLQHEYWPENFSATEFAARRENLVYIKDQARHIFAISEYTKRTLVEKLNWPVKMITVTPLAPSIRSSPPRPINLPSRFLFYPAALWPHKNHCLVIEVLHRLISFYPDLQVIFSGLIKKKNLKQELDVLIAKHGLTARVHFLGFVPDEVLQFIYTRATLLIFPSSFEGFGMPILEAYQQSLPVVAARNSSIVEIAGGAAILCETNNISEFTEAVDCLLKNDKVRETLKIKMAEQLKKFSWVKTATLTLAELKNQ